LLEVHTGESDHACHRDDVENRLLIVKDGCLLFDLIGNQLDVLFSKVNVLLDLLSDRRSITEFSQMIPFINDPNELRGRRA
jgi:hypothetical protein